jgi:hypothetical protein
MLPPTSQIKKLPNKCAFLIKLQKNIDRTFMKNSTYTVRAKYVNFYEILVLFLDKYSFYTPKILLWEYLLSWFLFKPLPCVSNKNSPAGDSVFIETLRIPKSI